MGIALSSSRRINVSREVAFGTPVVPTRALRGAYNLTQEVSRDYFEGLVATGYATRTVLNPVVQTVGSAFAVAIPLDLEQLLLPLLAGLDDDAPTDEMVIAAGGPYVWQFQGFPSARKAPRSMTVDHIDTDLANAYAQRIGGVMCTELAISWAEDGICQLTAALMGQKASLVAAAPALIPATMPQPISAARVAVSFGVANAVTLGAGYTEVLGQVYGGTLTVTTGLVPRRYTDGPDDGSISAFDLGSDRMMDLTLDVAVDPSAAGLLALHRDDMEETRYVEVLINGGALPAPAVGTAYVRARMACSHMDDSLADRGQDRDGNAIVSVHPRKQIG